MSLCHEMAKGCYPVGGITVVHQLALHGGLPWTRRAPVFTAVFSGEKVKEAEMEGQRGSGSSTCPAGLEVEEGTADAGVQEAQTLEKAGERVFPGAPAEPTPCPGRLISDFSLPPDYKVIN